MDGANLMFAVRTRLGRAGQCCGAAAGVALLAAVPAFSATAVGNQAALPAHESPDSVIAGTGAQTGAEAARDPVQGFRSATFGMDEAQLRKAIAEDFATRVTKIAVGENSAERTKVLSIEVPGLLAGGGTARVDYVLGYKSHGLIQVGVTWSKKTDAGLSANTLVQNADALREYFRKENFVPASVQLDQPIKGGFLMFRGQDAKGHEVVLLLLGSVKKVSDGKNELEPTTLEAIYVADPKHPDIFAIPRGKF